ncbi:MAG: helix-turn-helix domain-containing protein [Bacteroidales bacterium]|nr:helix-turn-helix domain-containing protein [Bacteroidales bacterium]
MDKNTITISQLQKMSRNSRCYGDDVLVTDRIDYIEPFLHPCRIDGVAVVLCTGGHIEGTINLDECRVEAGQVLVIFSSDIICLRRMVDVEGYIGILSTDFLHDINIDFRNRSQFYLKMRANAIVDLPRETMALLKPYFPLFLSCIDRSSESASHVLRALATAFSYEIIDLLMRHQEGLAEEHASKTRSQALFDQFLELLAKYRKRERTVAFYAQKLCLTPNYLTCAIRECSGRCVTDWINDSVALEAKNLLVNSSISIKEIAYQLNFPTQSSFGKYFKKITGLSPRAYRTQLHR